MMSHQAGVRTVVVGGRPEPGPMQATSGSRGASVYSAQDLDEDIAVSLDRVPRGTFPTLNNETQQRDSGMFLITANFNLRDQVRSATDSGPPLQFRYEAADCRLYWTLENALNMTKLWYDAAGAMWGLGLNASCVSGSIGYASHGVNATTTFAAPENKATHVPSLPVLEWNQNKPPGELEDFGLADSSTSTRGGWSFHLCNRENDRAPDKSVCLQPLPYTCGDNNKIVYPHYRYLPQCWSGLTKDTCRGSSKCLTTDDVWLESTQGLQLGQVSEYDLSQYQLNLQHGYCYPWPRNLQCM